MLENKTRNIRLIDLNRPCNNDVHVASLVTTKSISKVLLSHIISSHRSGISDGKNTQK